MAKVKKIARKRTVRNVKVSKKPVKTTKRGAVRVDIKELDPIRKCGPGTSVQVLLRVIERVEGKATNHLVFFDKHGWYCDHGRGCPAVAHARKQRRHLPVPPRR